MNQSDFIGYLQKNNFRFDADEKAYHKSIKKGILEFNFMFMVSSNKLAMEMNYLSFRKHDIYIDTIFLSIDEFKNTLEELNK